METSKIHRTLTLESKSLSQEELQDIFIPRQGMRNVLEDVDVLHVVGWTLTEEMATLLVHAIHQRCLEREHVAGDGQENEEQVSKAPLSLKLDSMTQNDAYVHLVASTASLVDSLTLKNNRSLVDRSGSDKRLLSKRVLEAMSHDASKTAHNKLQSLTISGMDLDPSTTQSLTEILTLPKSSLQQVVLSDNRWMCATACANILSRALQENCSLVELHFSSKLSGGGGFCDQELAQIFQGLKNHPKVARLILDHPNWQHSTSQAIGKLLCNDDDDDESSLVVGRRQHCLIKHIELSRQQPVRNRPSRRRNTERDVPPTALCLSPLLHGIANNAPLQTLKLSQCSLQNEDFQRLVHAASKCPTLVELDLSQNLISSLDLTTLNSHAPFPATTNLSRLVLTGNPASPTKKRFPPNDESVLAYGRWLHSTGANSNNTTTLQRRRRQEDLQQEYLEREQVRKIQCRHFQRLLECNPMLYDFGEEDFSMTSRLYTPYNQHLLDLNTFGRVLVAPLRRSTRAKSTTSNNKTLQRRYEQSDQGEENDNALQLSLWSHVLARTNRREWPSSTTATKCTSIGRSANVIYHLLRNHFCHGPSMFETSRID